MSQDYMAKLLKKLREDAGYSVEKIAQYFGGDVNLVNDWESGVDVPSAYDCFVLSELYGISLDSMFGALDAKEFVSEDSQNDFCREAWINKLARKNAG